MRKIVLMLMLAAVTVGGLCSAALAGETVRLKSSVIQEASYDASSRILSLVFSSGTRYEYAAVPSELFAGLKGADHPGAYFHAHIRNRFVGTPVTAGVAPRRRNCVAVTAQAKQAPVEAPAEDKTTGGGS